MSRQRKKMSKYAIVCLIFVLMENFASVKSQELHPAKEEKLFGAGLVQELDNVSIFIIIR